MTQNKQTGKLAPINEQHNQYPRTHHLLGAHGVNIQVHSTHQYTLHATKKAIPLSSQQLFELAYFLLQINEGGING